jgi:hypothetical protein
MAQFFYGGNVVDNQASSLQNLGNAINQYGESRRQAQVAGAAEDTARLAKLAQIAQLMSSPEYQILMQKDTAFAKAVGQELYDITNEKPGLLGDFLAKLTGKMTSKEQKDIFLKNFTDTATQYMSPEALTQLGQEVRLANQLGGLIEQQNVQSGSQEPQPQVAPSSAPQNVLGDRAKAILTGNTSQASNVVPPYAPGNGPSVIQSKQPVGPTVPSLTVPVMSNTASQTDSLGKNTSAPVSEGPNPETTLTQNKVVALLNTITTKEIILPDVSKDPAIRDTASKMYNLARSANLQPLKARYVPKEDEAAFAEFYNKAVQSNKWAQEKGLKQIKSEEAISEFAVGNPSWAAAFYKAQGLTDDQINQKVSQAIGEGNNGPTQALTETQKKQVQAQMQVSTTKLASVANNQTVVNALNKSSITDPGKRTALKRVSTNAGKVLQQLQQLDPDTLNSFMSQRYNEIQSFDPATIQALGYGEKTANLKMMEQMENTKLAVAQLGALGDYYRYLASFESARGQQGADILKTAEVLNKIYTDTSNSLNELMQSVNESIKSGKYSDFADALNRNVILKEQFQQFQTVSKDVTTGLQKVMEALTQTPPSSTKPLEFGMANKLGTWAPWNKGGTVEYAETAMDPAKQLYDQQVNQVTDAILGRTSSSTKGTTSTTKKPQQIIPEPPLSAQTPGF